MTNIRAKLLSQQFIDTTFGCIAASIPIRRAQETVGAGEWSQSASSKQLVSDKY
jgi:hypothetical protein